MGTRKYPRKKQRRTVPHVTLLAPNNMVAGDYSCVRINAHALTHTQTYTRSLSLSPTHTHMHLCLSFSKYTHTYTHEHIHIHVSTYLSIHPSTYLPIHVSSHICPDVSSYISVPMYRAIYPSSPLHAESDQETIGRFHAAHACDALYIYIHICT